MKLKRIISGVLAFVLCSSMCCISFADGGQSSETEVEITNVRFNEDANIAIDFEVPALAGENNAPWAPVGTSLVIYAADDEGGYTVPLYRTQEDVQNGSGSFEASIGLADKCKLLAVVTTPYGKSEQEFDYVNKIIDKINNDLRQPDVSGGDVLDFISQYAENLCINPKYVDELGETSVITNAVLAAVRDEHIKTVGNFQYIYAANLLVGFINESKSTAYIKDFIKAESSYLGKLYKMWTDSFGGLSDEALTSELTALKGKDIDTADKLVEYLTDSTVAEFFKSVKYYKDYSTLFVMPADTTELTNIYGLSYADVSEYNNLENRKDLALSKLWDINKASAINTFAKLKSAIGTAVTYAKNATIESTSPSYGGGKKGVGGAIVAPPAVTEPQPSGNVAIFNDVAADAWYAQPVKVLYAEGIVDGKGNGIFEPDVNVTREEFAQMLYKLIKADADTKIEFDDVSDSDWYAAAVRALYSKNIVQGMGNSFGVGKNITRQDMAVMIYNTLVYFGRSEMTDKEIKPTDFETVSDYAQNAVSSLMSLGLLNGYSDGSFLPRNNLTRAEAAQSVYSLINYMEVK